MSSQGSCLAVYILHCSTLSQGNLLTAVGCVSVSIAIELHCNCIPLLLHRVTWLRLSKFNSLLLHMVFRSVESSCKVYSMLVRHAIVQLSLFYQSMGSSENTTKSMQSDVRYFMWSFSSNFSLCSFDAVIARLASQLNCVCVCQKCIQGSETFGAIGRQSGGNWELESIVSASWSLSWESSGIIRRTSIAR